MIRIVADANVLVSAAIGRSPDAPSARLFDAALDDRVELVTSPMLLAEIASVLRRPRLRRYLSLDDAERFVADLAAVTALTADAPLPHATLCRDPRDDYLVALAAHVGADAIVSGDRDLLELAEPPVPVLTPRAALERLESQVSSGSDRVDAPRPSCSDARRSARRGVRRSADAVRSPSRDRRSTQRVEGSSEPGALPDDCCQREGSRWCLGPLVQPTGPPRWQSRSGRGHDTQHVSRARTGAQTSHPGYG